MQPLQPGFPAYGGTVQGACQNARRPEIVENAGFRARPGRMAELGFRPGAVAKPDRPIAHLWCARSFRRNERISHE